MAYIEKSFARSISTKGIYLGSTIIKNTYTKNIYIRSAYIKVVFVRAFYTKNIYARNNNVVKYLEIYLQSF